MTWKFLLPAALTLAVATPAFAATDNFLLVNGNGAPVAVPVSAQQMPGYGQQPQQPQQPSVPNTGGTSTPMPQQRPTAPNVPNTGEGGTAGATEVALLGSLALALGGAALMRRYRTR